MTIAMLGGDLYSVGHNQYAQLGSGSATSASPYCVESWNKVSAAAGGWTANSITAIAAGSAHTLVLAGVEIRCLGMCPLRLSVPSGFSFAPFARGFGWQHRGNAK